MRRPRPGSESTVARSAHFQYGTQFPLRKRNSHYGNENSIAKRNLHYVYAISNTKTHFSLRKRILHYEKAVNHGKRTNQLASSESLEAMFVCRTPRQSRSVRLWSRTLRLFRASESRDFVARLWRRCDMALWLKCTEFSYSTSWKINNNFKYYFCQEWHEKKLATNEYILNIASPEVCAVVLNGCFSEWRDIIRFNRSF